MHSIYRSLFVVLALAGTFSITAQNQQPTPTPSPAATGTPSAATTATPRPLTAKELIANPTAEAVAETSIYVYGLAGGRAALDQIRKTTIERGKTTVMNAEGKMETANYSKWVIRGASIEKEKLRYEQEFPRVRFALILDQDRTYGIFNEQRFAPTDEASKAFHNQVYRGLDGLLRYKENGSKIELIGKEKLMGVEYHKIDVTDKVSRKTRYFVSTKTFKIMMLEYEEEGKKYRRKFHDYNYAQGTLVPFRTVLYEGDKMIEETNIGTITFGQKVEETLFPAAG